ncbi:MAG TPA: nicotinate-nucleotide diphosphorylase (carboxylating), partial [Alcaligenes faecalis]|nr:nicotinate-nucleotide diphosphorylase (carboxylating) [Alcaligenes faecalis]
MSIINAPEPTVQAVETRAHRIPSLPDVILEPLARATLQEDLGRAGDLTTDSIVPATARTQMRLVAREEGVLAGLDLARLA